MNTDKTNATKLHSLTQKSQTLYRRATQKPTSNTAQPRRVGRSMDIARSKHVTHFVPHTTTPQPTKPVTPQKPSLDISPTRHPLAARVEAIRNKAQTQATVASQAIAKSAKTIKEEAIAEALSRISEEKVKQANNLKRQSKKIRKISIIVGIILLIIFGFIVYFNMPSLSVSIANAQAGISATYPEYHPDGYSPSGPVTYSDGQVTINFHANTGDSKYTINQTKSPWDSSAVKNQVSKDAGNAVVNTFEERGLTIYTYGGNAAWVNGGILYNIAFSGEAPLSVDQIRRIATSL